ncbi:MAG: cupin domain-containing protein [Thermoplasmata archaeon]|nr:cupin domain-containing protein [Thermoplasmata archaeon]
MYVVLSGRARFRCGRSDYRVGPGSILHVPAGARHSFQKIEQELRVVVLFAPAEYSRDRGRRRRRRTVA